MDENYFCPLPDKWNEVYGLLLSFWHKSGSAEKDMPPVPLILAAWHETTGLQKLIRWKETVEWANRHGCKNLIPELKDNEKFKG